MLEEIQMLLGFFELVNFYFDILKMAYSMIMIFMSSFI